MKILHVMSDIPYPPDNGARADIWARIKAMKNLGHEIHMVVVAPVMGSDESRIAKTRQLASIRLVRRRALSKSLLTTVPTYIRRNTGLAECPIDGAFDLTLVESENALPILDNPRLNTRTTVLRLHNDEVAYLRDFIGAEERFVKRQFLRLELLRLISFCHCSHLRVDALWFISESERQSFTRRYPGLAHKAMWLPPSIEIGERRKRASRPHGNRVLFVGNFFTSMNRDGLRWYFRHVHPVLAQYADYEFVVAGSTQGRPEARLFAQELKQYRRCVVHVDAADIRQLYEDCDVFVNPIHGGAGVKLKNVHAIECGIPVVSTTMGNDGSGFTSGAHLRIADTPADFACAILEFLDDGQLRQATADRAFERLNELYSPEQNLAQMLSQVVANLSSNKARYSPKTGIDSRQTEDVYETTI